MRPFQSLLPLWPFQGMFGQQYQREAIAALFCGTLSRMLASSLRVHQDPYRCSICNHHLVRHLALGMAFARLLGRVSVLADSLVHLASRARLVSLDRRARHVLQGVPLVMTDYRARDVAWSRSCQIRHPAAIVSTEIAVLTDSVLASPAGRRHQMEPSVPHVHLDSF